MSKILKLIVDFEASEGTASNCPADATKIKNRVEESSISGVVRFQGQISDGATDVNISIPDANSEYLLVFTDRELLIKLNGGSESLTIKPKISGTKSFAFYLKGDITELLVSNSSGDIANIDVISVNV